MSVIVEKSIKAGSKKFRVVVEKYNSAVEVSEDCKTRAITDECFDNMSKKHLGSWDGVKSYDEALELMRNGYQPTVEKLRERMKVSKMGDGKRISFVNNIVGAVPVVPLAMMGVPNNMVDMRMKPIKCKVLDVYYDLTCSCGVDSDDIIRNGQKVLGAILELEKQGYKFNLYAVQTYSGDDDVDVLCVKIKSSSQPLDLKRMSFPLTHTAFFRVIGFDWYSKCPKAKYRSGYGRGLAYRLNNKECDEFAKKVFGDNALYISGKQILYENEEYLKEVLTTNESNKK